MPKLLMFVAKSDPILRDAMPVENDFNDASLQATIEDMCYSILPDQLRAANACHESAAGMAANQWGVKRRVFIYTPDGSDAAARKEVMINPSYKPYLRRGETEPEMAAAYEGCFSVPLTTGIVNRYEAIIATYFTPAGKKIEMLMEGWEARVFQHETDHLNGKLFDGKLDNFAGPDCVDRIIFKDEAEMEDFWVNKVRPSRE
jgi:peptide deformylase